MKTILLYASLLATTSVIAQEQDEDYRFHHAETTTARPEAIWTIWTDVPNWPKWDTGLRDARLNGAFGEGARGTLLPDRGHKARFRIEAVETGKGYTLKTRIPFGWLRIRRSLEVVPGGTAFRHQVEFTGPFRKLLGRKLGRRYRAMLPEAMGRIKAIAEKSEN